MKSIYVIGPKDGPYKVGIAGSPQKRKAELQIGNPVPLYVHFDAPDENAAMLEQITHIKLKAHNMRGEWFDVELDRVIEAIESSVPPYEPPPSPTVDKSFPRWLDEMKMANLISRDDDAAELLGISALDVELLKRDGADHATALACRALLHRMEPYF